MTAKQSQDGHYEMEYAPVSMEGLKEPKGEHTVVQTMTYQLALRSKESGNEAVKKGDWEAAVSRYSEGIMQCRQAEGERDVIEDDAAFKEHRTLIATFYLNLSHCFLSLNQWTHAYNCVTRAIQGDKDPADPKHDVLDDAKKAKAYFRRATAKMSMKDMDDCVKDLETGLKLAPEDKALQQALNNAKRDKQAADKKADKKMAGFLKSEKGESKLPDFGTDRKPEVSPIPVLKEPIKMSEGLWVAPKQDHVTGASGQEEGPTVGDIMAVEDELQAKAKALALKDPEAKEKMKQMGIDLWKDEEGGEKAAEEEQPSVIDNN